MLQPTGLSHAHFECRSLDETLPIFTDLLACRIVERKDGEATVRHPNTGWLLVIHEGGPHAPDKPRSNHYGFRVSDHNEIDAAWEYLKANRENFRLGHITEPDEAHFAYSVYFSEPGGNTLEIEYYNPKAALHGRSVAAAHWKTPLTPEQFLGRGYIPQAMTHGTLDCDNLEASRRFYREVLGLEIVGGGKTSTYISHPSAPWYIVVLPAAKRQHLRPVNRFTLTLASPQAVEDAYREFSNSGKRLGITELWDIEHQGQQVSFTFSDMDRNWWEATAGS
jgi:catechol 2,3-dioxygenase-like lactoylglutathione lyase family enzyme